MFFQINFLVLALRGPFCFCKCLLERVLGSSQGPFKLGSFFQMFTFVNAAAGANRSGGGASHGVSFYIHCGAPFRARTIGALHNWLDLRVLVEIRGFFSGGNGVSRYK